MTLSPWKSLIFAAAATLALSFNAAAQSPKTDPAYLNGYQAGYTSGQQDHAASASENAHKFSAYQQADSGYSPAYGATDRYRAAYQSGFEDGYADGFHSRPSSVSATPAPPPNLPAPPLDPIRQARANGYREGYNVGQADANHSTAYNATASNTYQQGTVGYTPDLGASDQYQLNFRSGFTAGYDDGFNHRLYNAAIGARRPPENANGNNPPPAGNLLPDADHARGRASGVYDNGILVAEGTNLLAVLNNTLSTKKSHVGDKFTLTVTVPVWAGATAAIPAGSTISGVVKDIKKTQKGVGSAEMDLQYDTIAIPGMAPVALNATTGGVGQGADKVDPEEGTVHGQSANTGASAAKDAAMGGAIGGIFGGMGGLIRGGIAGAVVGTAGGIFSHNNNLTLNDGERIRVRLEQPLELPTGPPRL